MKTHFADTLLQLFGKAELPAAAGLHITELEVELPLEVSSAWLDGELVFLAQAPHSRWQGGFQPPLQRTRVKLALEE